MPLKISACLAAMLVACPLACQTAWADGWNDNKNNTKDTASEAESSNNNPVNFPRTSGTQENYEYIYIGNALGSANKTKVITDGNVGTIGSGVTVSGEVIGGYAYWEKNPLEHDFEIKVLNNSVTLQSGSKVETAIGGYGYAVRGHVAGSEIENKANGTVQKNSVTVDEGAEVKTIYGGRGGLLAYVDEEGSEFTNDNFKTDFSVLENAVTVTGTSFESAYGGYAEARTASVSNNTIEVKKGTSSAISTGELVGGYAGGNAYNDDDGGSVEASGNIVKVTQSTVNKVFGGKAAGIFGKTATAKGNEVTLSDSEVQGTVYAGYAGADYDTYSVTGTASGNKLYLNGGTYNGDIYGGYAKVAAGTAEASGNLVALGQGSDKKSPDLENSTIYGGYAYAADEAGTTSGNKLTFSNVTGMKAVNIKNFQKLSYEGYSEMQANEVILELTDREGTSIAKAEVSVSVGNLIGSGDGEFKEGDKVILLKNDSGLVTDGIQTKVIKASTGISFAYEVVITTNEENTELILTRTASDESDDGRDSKDPFQPGTKAIAEGAAAGLALAGESSNAAIEFLREFSLTAGSITPFVHVQASSMRHETGSSINMSAVSLLAGLGTGIDTGAGHLSAGAFFEYGKGSYTTNNSFDTRSDIDGDGNAWYMGGGIVAKMDFVPTGPGHFYLEGSAHMGTLHNEYDSNNLYDANGNVAKFDMDSPYYSLHGGLGYVWNMAEGHDLDIYGKYIWTRVQGTDDTLTTKDKFEYDDMDSNRIRLGARYTYKGSERFSPYVGAAFEHEFSGSCESTAYGHPVAAPSFEGSSGMGELGLVMNPSESLPLTINLGVQGYVGQKQGIAGNCTMKYEF